MVSESIFHTVVVESLADLKENNQTKKDKERMTSEDLKREKLDNKRSISLRYFVNQTTFIWICYCLTASLNWDQHPDSGQYGFYWKSLPLLNIFNTF